MSAPAQAAAAVDPEADPEVQAVLEVFRSGDFGAARRELLRLRREAPAESTRRAADAALDRLRPDPVALVLLVGCLIAFVVVILVTR